ncbi:MAG: sulfatase [Planctomycetota bacterium]
MPNAPLNFILLQGEDTGRHQGCYGDPFAHTPHLDRLAAQGCRFTNAFSTAPVCAPSRSAMITGQYHFRYGAHLMRSTVASPPRLFTHELIDAGYTVNWTNKTDFNFADPDGFASLRTDWLAQLEQGQLPDGPFFFYFNFAPTHESGMWPPGTKPGGPTGEGDYSGPLSDPGVPGIDHETLARLPVPPYLPDTPTTRASLFRYYRHLANQDAYFGRVLQALDDTGLADSTVVIYLTDHGRGLVREKRWCYEAGVHLPLIVRAPQHTSLAPAGSVRDDLVSWVDLAPTLHALAGIPVPDRYDGRVFLGPDTQPEPDCVFAGRDRMDEAGDRVRAARDRRYLYARNDFTDIPYAQRNLYMELSPVTREVRELHAAGKLNAPQSLWMATDRPAEELYDTATDPHCVKNLAADPAQADTLARLRQATLDWQDDIGDLGRRSETDLVESGILVDQRAAYGRRVRADLPDHLNPDGVYNTRYMPDRV